MIKRKIIFSIFLTASFGLKCKIAFSQNTAITNLQCEYLNNPIGIDNPHPRFTWKVNCTQGCQIENFQIVVGLDSVSVSNGKGEIWSFTSDKQLLQFAGNPLKPFTKYFWKVVALNDIHNFQSNTSSFETGMLDQKNWKGNWISDVQSIQVKPAPYFRKIFSVSKKVIAARAFVSAAGLYELFINGNRVGDHYLDPMFTRYDRRNLYVTYDVTQTLQTGNNAIGVLLGNGWYNFQSLAVWDYERAPWRNRPAFCLDLRITYEDGSVETISSDKTWKTALGPLIYNSIYTGEHYDARLEMSGWNTTDFNDEKWSSVIIRQASGEKIISQTMPPIRRVELLKPVSMERKNDTTWLFNLGRNIAGVTELQVYGDSSTFVKVIHAERLDKNGNIDQSNVDYFLRDAKKNNDFFATDIYYLSGKSPQTFSPHFDYKGFQYVQVQTNKSVDISKESLVAYSMHSDVPKIGNIKSSNQIINKIYNATNASYLANLFGYPTDCPQREKNGWTGDAHIAVETGLYNYDAITIYEKWLNDMRDEQQPNGTLPSIVPTSGWGYEWGNGPDWTSALVIIPWNVYLFYGDDKILKDNYESIKRYIDRITSTSSGGLTSWGLGDWIPVKSTTPVEFTSTIYYYACVDIFCKMAKILKKDNDARIYNQLRDEIKIAFNKKYLNKEKAIYGKGVQTELATALYWNIAPEELKFKIAKELADAVAINNYHLDVGLLGTKAILSALSDNGQAETAYKLATQTEYPSWGWWMKNGATTLYENWNINANRDLSMNHIMFGEIGAWFYKGLGGIKVDENNPGFKNVLLAPNFVEGLNEFSAEHNGPYGNIVSSWKRKKSIIYYEVIIPSNSRAKITFSNLKNKVVYRNNQIVDTKQTIDINSGRYVFLIK